ncbi:hypothetical protein J6894_01900 [Nakaseomyces glabratus]|nr:hypothetical protein J6894_01900 [Nakaseomyces glabratus]
MPNFTGALCNYTISTVVPQTTDCSLPALLLPFSLPPEALRRPPAQYEHGFALRCTVGAP